MFDIQGAKIAFTAMKNFTKCNFYMQEATLYTTANCSKEGLIPQRRVP